MLRLSLLLLFLTSFYFQKVSAHCDVTRTGSRGEIKSPNYPQNYLANEVCHYTITTEPGTIIRLTFQAFKLDCGEENSACRNIDYVEIYDGGDINATRFGKFGGDRLPPEVHSSQNSLFLVFHTDSRDQFSGFLANYSTIWLTAPPVNNVAVTSLSSSSALVHWKALCAPFTVDNYTVTVKPLARRHSPPPGCPALPPLHSASSVTVNGSTTETVICLPTDLEFQVFVTSITSGGISGVASDTVTGYTLPTASEAVRDLRVELTNTNETGNFTWKSPCNPGGALSHFLVVLEADKKDRLAENYILYRHVAQPLEEICSISMALSKLAAESLYTVTVTPVGLHGLYGANHTTTFQVPARVPTQPQNVVATALSSSSVRVQWDLLPQNLGTITHYTVRLQPLPHHRSFVPPLQTSVVDVSGSTLQTEVTNLMSDTLYQATVTASTSAGQGPASALLIVQLPSKNEVPTEPQKVSATALSSSAVRVEWEPPTKSNGKLTFYIVTLEPIKSTNPMGAPINKTVITVAGSTLQTEIDHLLAGTVYKAVVIATTASGQGPPSTPSVVFTPPEDKGNLSLLLEILRGSYITSRDLLCSARPLYSDNESEQQNIQDLRSNEEEWYHLCSPTGKILYKSKST